MNNHKQKNVVVCEFNQESNSFSPEITQRESFEYYGIYEGKELIQQLKGKPRAINAMLNILNENNINAVPACSMYSQSGGRVNHDLVKWFIERITSTIKAQTHVDGIFISLHGATQSTESEDVCGLILKCLRQQIGDNAVIVASLDLHANITKSMMNNCDYLSGFQTYPHTDYYETGARVAKLGVEKLTQGTDYKMVKVAVPMIIPANAYSTLEGDFKALIDYAHSTSKAQSIEDFSVLMMQPWLDVKEASSNIIAIAKDEQKAKTFAIDLAQRMYQIRKKMKPTMFSIEDVIQLTKENNLNKPVIMVDCADSSNAGASGDGAIIIKKILDSNTSFKAASVLSDAPAANKAHELGVGVTAHFSLGGTIDPQHQQAIQVKATIKSLHSGIFTQEGPAGKGTVINIGKTAVLSINNIDVVVCHKVAGNGDPQLYRAFGIEPLDYQLVVVKACSSFKVAYQPLAAKICQTDTPGAAASDLLTLDFKHLPRPFYPFDSLDEFEVSQEPLKLHRALNL